MTPDRDAWIMTVGLGYEYSIPGFSVLLLWHVWILWIDVTGSTFEVLGIIIHHDRFGLIPPPNVYQPK
jgi:hypothetical protein